MTQLRGKLYHVLQKIWDMLLNTCNIWALFYPNSNKKKCKNVRCGGGNLNTDKIFDDIKKVFSYFWCHVVL